MKRKMGNRILSFFLAFAITLSAIPATVFAQESAASTEADTDPLTTTEGEQSGLDTGNEPDNSAGTDTDEGTGTESDSDTSEGTPDEGTPDEGTPDEGTPDEGTPDEGTPDEGTPDEGTPDEGTPDEGTTDEDTPGEEKNLLEGESQEGAETSLLPELQKLVNQSKASNDTARVSVEGNIITVDAGGLILLSNTNMDLTGYTIYLTVTDAGADLTQTITVVNSETKEGEQTTTSELTFQGLGTEKFAFSGSIQSDIGKYAATTNVPFFNNVDVSKAKLEFQSLTLKRGAAGNSALLARTVLGVADDSWSKLDVVAEETVDINNDKILPGQLIDTMAAGSSLSLGSVSYQKGATVTAAPGNGNVGLLCNTMGSNSTLSVGQLTVGKADADSVSVTVTTDNGAAGGLVGCMERGASLTVVNAATNDSKYTIAGTSAGGMVGYMESSVSLTVNADAGTAVTIGSNFTITGQNTGGLIGSGTDVKLGGTKVTMDGATVNGSTAAGGLIGSYTTNGAEGSFTAYDGASTLNVNNVTLNTTADNAYAGGLFGVLELKNNFTISDASVTSSIAGSKAYYGGLVGQVKGDSADSLRALTVRGNSNLSTSTSVNLNGYAGAVAVIGKDGNSPVYVKIADTFRPTFVGANLLRKDIYFGGVAAYLKSDSVLELTANVTIAYDKISETNGYGGGVLGKAERGSTLCLGGTTDLSGTKFKETYINEYTGQIVGTQESALIYAKSDWTLIRQSTAQPLDDIGNYGEVIRLGGNMGKSTPSGEQKGLSADLIFQNAKTHKTEFLDSAKLTLTDNTFTVTSANQLALLAIEEQTKCAFQIYGTGEDYYFKSNPSKNITLGADISLAHTGITGLQRDIDVGYAYAGTLDGQKDGRNHTLTIAAGEIYGYRGADGTEATDATAGSGQIHGHTQVGFFSEANATVTDLTVAGSMNLYFRTDSVAGGLTAKNTGSSTYTNVKTSVTIQNQGTMGGSIGGLVGVGEALTLTNCTGSASVDIGNSAVYAGGLIGQYTGETLSVSGATLSGSMTAKEANHARLGGLVSRIAKGSYDVVNVTLTDITVNGQTITGTGMKGSTVNNVTVLPSCGGLLGYEWNNASVTFNGLTVTGTDSVNSSVSVDGSTETAGLVYAATGYWQVNDINLEKLSVESGKGDLGLLICRGWRKDVPTTAGTTTKPYLLYLEETANNAYQIGTVNVTVGDEPGYFDEWVAYTCEKTETITNNGNSVISIATAAETGGKVEGVRVGVDPSGENCTSYQNRTEYGKKADTKPNPNARYYYDLDIIREKATTNQKLDTPGELVLWAVWRYSEEKTITEKSNIQDYFLIKGKTYDIYGTKMDGDYASIDLTGYAYYPVTVDGFSLEVKNITIKFANQKIETAEGLTGGSLNRTTVGTTSDHTQHYLLHSGLLLNYQNSKTSGDVTMTVSNVTFQGTIGKGPNGGSGALICGQLGGYTHATKPKNAKLDVQSVILAGVSVNGDRTGADTDYAPLLVNRVGSYSALSAQNVSTDYPDDTSADNPAATSLIGHVGDENAMNITLAFSNDIALNGKKDKSIFSHATLLESFRYQSGGSGYYRFNKGEVCTYGYEINNSVENPGLQLKYFDQSEQVADNSVQDFSNYLPYVCKKYTDGKDRYHELEVNIASPDLTEGCGTYDDPYIISAPRQLMWVADFINGNDPKSGWKVNKVANAAIIKTDAEDNHTEYEVGKTGWNDAAMRTYMRGAYYKINKDLEGDLTLKSFAGFGSVDNPFVGVFDGNGKAIIIENAGSGFINVSYGSVVQNLTVRYTRSKTLTDKRPTGVTGDNSKEVYADSYFGGIIGTVLGGDSLIDKVTVTFADGFTITTSYDLQCAGGFVGLIQGGGVVFRNMDSANNKGYTHVKSKDRYYVDNYIGRVLDGYAINVVAGSDTTASVTFAGKNYSIPDISATNTNAQIAWNDGNISIENAQQMIIFTDIINSGAASGGSAPAYSDGAKTRNGDYSFIGKVDAPGFDGAFSASRKDDSPLGAENYPYLITKYVNNGNADFWGACKTGTAISITFTKPSIDLSKYSNGYRGIGGRYSCNANGGTLTNNTPKIKAVTGNGVSLHVENDIAEYRADNFYANSVGGLFNVLRHEGATISGVNVYGTVKVCAGLEAANEGTESKYLSRAPVGGIIGRDYCESSEEKTLKLSKVSFGSASTESNSTVYGECVTGGLIGSSGSYAATVLSNYSCNKTILSLENCSYQKVTIVGGICTGGFVGSIIPNYDSFATYNAAITPGSTREIQWTESIIFGMGSEIQNLFFSGSGSNGAGGLIGLSCAPFTIAGAGEASVVLNGVTLHGGKSNNRGRIGGVVGFVSNQTAITCTITNIELNGLSVGNSDKYDDNTGGFIGTWYSKGSLTISDCSMKSSTVQGEGNGGIVGYAGYSGTIYVINILLDGNKIQSRGGATDSFYSGGIGGYCAIDFYGKNILLKNTQYIYSTTNKSDRIGRLFGTGDKVRLLGVSIQRGEDNQGNDNLLPQKDIFNKTYPTDYGTTNYVVYAGYNSSSTITTASEIATKPSTTVARIGELHGDTVVPTTVVAAAGDSGFYQNAGTTDKLTQSICSTYNNEQYANIEDDFDVVVIDGDASVLLQYLNAATNGGFDSARACGKVAVKVDRYYYKSSDGFKNVTDSSPETLKYNAKTGTFTSTTEYDNQNHTFTLVTVTITEKATGGEFVLHIPVIVRRMLQVDFMATMTSGTVFNTKDTFYNDTQSKALASMGENITGYLTFHYNSNASDTRNPASYDWQSYMEAGGDLLGYYKKTLETGDYFLPKDTKITLIDCQNGYKRYYAKVEQEGDNKLKLFSDGNLTYQASDGKTEFTPACLADLLKIQASEDPDKPDSVKWVRLSPSEGQPVPDDATVKDKEGNYYRKYDEAKGDTAETNVYYLTVTETTPREDYFVVLSVPVGSSHRLTVNNNSMVWSKEKSPPIEVHQVHRYDMTVKDSDSGSESTFNFRTNYGQDLNDQTNPESKPVQIMDASTYLPVHILDTVSFNKNSFDSTDPLYCKMIVSLKKTENGTPTGVGIPSDAVAVTGTDSGIKENAVKLYAYYKDGSGQSQYYVLTESGWGFTQKRTAATSYSWSASAEDSTEMVLPFAQKTDTGYRYIDLAGLRNVSGNAAFYIEAETTLEMSVASILANNTIPYDDGRNANYTQVRTTSILSITESGLSYSTLRASTDGQTKYYLNTERKAVLKLDYTNIDQLGINARVDQSAVIDTVLTLDFSNMEGFVSDVEQFETLSNADTVKFTLSLWQKRDEESGTKYVEIPKDDNYSEYLTGAAIPKDSQLPDYTITLKRNEDGSYPYYNEQTGLFTIPISFTVNMSNRKYANYRIHVSASLWKGDDSQFFDMDTSGNYITYTFAKINVNGYWGNQTGTTE